MKFQKPNSDFCHSFRRAFVRKYVDQNQPFYRNSVNHGEFYGNNNHRSCLWESFGSYNVISKNIALDIIRAMPEIYVMWDNSSANLSRRLQKSRMINITGEEMYNALTSPSIYRDQHCFHPSDIYCVAPDLSSYVVFTHVSVCGVGSVCITSRDDLADYGITTSYRRLFQCFRENQIL